LCSPKPAPRHLEIRIGQRAAVRFRTFILDPKRGLLPQRSWKNNLILDSGLDSIGARTWAANVEYFAVGSGTNPTVKDSGATTLSRAGTTVTASAGFFAAGDVNALIRWDTGETAYIASFTDTTHVETVSTGTIAAAEGAVYYVNQTALQTELKRSLTTSSLGAGNSVAWNVGTSVWKITRTIIFTAEVGAVTYNEAGWTWQAAGSIFGRSIISGGDSLTAGQQYVISLELSITFSPTTLAAKGNVGTLIDTTGNIVIESAWMGTGAQMRAFSQPGELTQGVLEPSSAQLGTFASLNNWTQQATTATGRVAGPVSVTKAGVNDAYSTGSHTRTRTAAFTVSEAVGNIVGVGLYGGPSPDHANGGLGFTLKFSTVQPKTALQTMTVVYRFTWDRVYA